MKHKYIEIQEWQANDYDKVFGIDKKYAKRKTKSFNVINKKYGDILGIIKWNNGWRQYCFYPEDGTVWSEDCLEVVKTFIEERNRYHEKGWKI